MQFELDNVLTDQILFYMENQDGDFFLDTLERKVIDILSSDFNEDINLENERYISLPRWLPNDGYRLMEKFSAALKNPVARHELAQALNRNKGVFRAYRNVLEQYPEIEKLWFTYKNTEMKKNVILWYNALREEWGLAPVGSEPEETASLVLEDFNIELQSTSDDIIEYTAQSAGGECAGSIKGIVKGSCFYIDNIEVKPAYQGLGIGKTLLSKLIETADKKNFEIIIDLPANVEYFARSLHFENFKPVSQRFIRNSQQNSG